MYGGYFKKQGTVQGTNCTPMHRFPDLPILVLVKRIQLIKFTNLQPLALKLQSIPYGGERYTSMQSLTS